MKKPIYKLRAQFYILLALEIVWFSFIYKSEVKYHLMLAALIALTSVYLGGVIIEYSNIQKYGE